MSSERHDSFTHIAKDLLRRSHVPAGARLAPARPGNWAGNLVEFRENTVHTFVRAMQEQGDVARLRLLALTAHAVFHPDHVRHVLQEQHRIYTKATRGMRMLKLFLGEGLLTSEGDFWLRQRRIAQPGFHRERIAHFGQAIGRVGEESAVEALGYAGTGRSIDVAELMNKATFRLVGETLFSADFEADAKRVSEALSFVNEDTIARIQHPLTLPLDVPTLRNLHYRRATATLDDVVHRTIAHRRASTTPAHDLLSMLMDARDADTGEGMSDKQLRDEVMTIMLAGHETTSNALTWTLYLLSTAPHVRVRLEQELDEVLGGRTPTSADIPNLRYTKMVLDESMRLYPPAHTIARSPSVDDSIGGYFIPARSLVFVPVYAVHRHPAIWSNPEGFDPERFSPERAASIPRYAHIPFGGGPRLCIGQAFAMLEAQLLLATLCQRTRFDLAPGHVVEMEPLITLRPKGGMPMTITRRVPMAAITA